MDIIIIGAGQVGSSVAENLVGEDNNVTVIDLDASRLQVLGNRLDILTVHGNGAYPTILRKAGADTADMLIAVSRNDEANMIACQVGYSLFHIPTKIARIRARDYFIRNELFGRDDLPIDFFISPETEITGYIQRLIDFPGAQQVLDFSSGKVRMVATKFIPDKIRLDALLEKIHAHVPVGSFQIIAVYRRNCAIALARDTLIEKDDELFFVTDSHYVRMALSIICEFDRLNQRVMIAGGGNIGFSLAEALQLRYQVKIIEHNVPRAQNIAQSLGKTIVLLGEASDKDLLSNENIEHTDVFCALTNDDEANIMSAIQAKRLGVRQVITLINRTNYVDLIEGGEIDVVISPQLITINTILTHLRQGDIVNVYSLRRGAAEAIEVIAHGDEFTSNVVGKKISDIVLPPHTIICAVVRGEHVFIGQSDVILQSDDHVVLFLSEKKHIHQVEQLFQVNITFF